MDINGLQKLTLLDYPGKVACTVFLGGCDFRCPFCHNFQLVVGPFPPEMPLFRFRDCDRVRADQIPPPQFLFGSEIRQNPHIVPHVPSFRG
jgi:pyruvate-formate lyase-activating enzyme